MDGYQFIVTAETGISFIMNQSRKTVTDLIEFKEIKVAKHFFEVPKGYTEETIQRCWMIQDG
jgi:hypothetical protein